MSPDELIPMVMAFALVIIVLNFASRTYRRGIALKERELEIAASGIAERAEHFAGKAEALEQRVRVLERLATDRGQDLAMEIEDLRDKREKVQ
jgi:hypothetical protein